MTEAGKTQSSEQDLLWELLLDAIQGGEVIPVLGSELLTVHRDGQRIDLAEELAAELAKRLGLNGHEDGTRTVATVAAQYFEERGEPDRLYQHLQMILRDVDKLETPTPLRQLAEIAPFSLFVTTTGDRLLERVLEEVRGERPETKAYWPNAEESDLPEEYPETEKKERGTVVYHLLGVAGSDPFAATEEDMLEFLHSLQHSARRPDILLNELGANQLLLIGCRFPDWLTRFFIRTVRGKRLTERSSKQQVVAGGTVRGDHALLTFLKHFSAKTSIFEDLDAAEFVNELHTRWRERHPLPDTPPDSDEPGFRPPPPPPEPQPAERAVFISYSRPDLEEVQRLRDALPQKLPVWFDQDQGEAGLDPGDDWELKIQRNIYACAMFVPVISRDALEREEAFFRTEWHYALERQKRFTGSDRKFIVPVSVDDTTPGPHEGLPNEFMVANWIDRNEWVQQIVEAYKKAVKQP